MEAIIVTILMIAIAKCMSVKIKLKKQRGRCSLCDNEHPIIIKDGRPICIDCKNASLAPYKIEPKRGNK